MAGSGRKPAPPSLPAYEFPPPPPLPHTSKANATILLHSLIPPLKAMCEELTTAYIMALPGRLSI